MEANLLKRRDAGIVGDYSPTLSGPPHYELPGEAEEL